MLKVSLFEKLIIAFMLLGIGAIIVVGLYSYYSARNAQMERTYDQLASVRYLKKKQVETFYADRVNDLESLLLEPSIQTLLKDNSISGPSRSLSPVMTNILRNRGLYRYILIFHHDIACRFTLDTNGLVTRVYGGSKLPPVASGLFKDRSTAYISDLLPDTVDSGWIQQLIIPVKTPASGKSVALGLELISSAIDSIMSDHNPLNGLGASGEAYLAGRDCLLRSSSRFIPRSVLSTRIDTATARLAFSGREGTWLLRDYRGIEVLGSFAKLSAPAPEWAIIAEIDMQESMVPIITIRNNILFITVFIAIIFFLVTWFLSRKITNPVIKLKNAALELGKGKLGTQVDVLTNDEIGELAESFNLMSAQLLDKDVELQKERNRRMRAAFDRQDIERQRLSRELHDGLGQSLIAQKLRLEALQLDGQERADLLLGDLKLCSDQLVDEVRRISNDLMPAQLNQFGLVSALKQHCNEVSRLSGIDISFDSTGNFETMSRKTKTYLFRIVQEALNNIVKHAQAKTAMVEMAHTREHLFISISDDGIGFTPENNCSGNGMNNMRERTMLLNGTFSVHSQPENGTTIEIQLPSKG